MPERPTLPELARSLRTLGAGGDEASAAAQQAIFRPLLDARARAAEANDVAAVLAALLGVQILAQIQRAVEHAATSGVLDPRRGRARTAAAFEAIELLGDRLARLDVLAASVHDVGPHWDAWVAQLRLVFASADEACTALALVITEPAVARPDRRGWFTRRTP